MRKVALLYNSRSGSRRNHRETGLRAAVKVLREAGIEAGLIRTQSSGDASEQARRAVLEGCDAILACGGDGTVNDILQSLAGSRVALGVIPMGTANALAHDLEIPMKPPAAARAALSAEPRRIALGRATVRGLDGNPLTRYFTVAVGIGVDAHLFYKLHSGTKQRLGMGAYYAKAWHLWFTHRMEQFRVEWEDNPGGSRSRTDVTEMLAVRIRNFGGVLRELAPGASLDREDVRLVLCQTSSRLSYLAYMVRGLLGRTWSIPGVKLIHSQMVRCDYTASGSETGIPKVYVEADGELIGTLPAEIAIVPDALTILFPRNC